jgi:hypothetical protein
MDQNKFNQVVDLLKQDGNTNQQVWEFLAELSQQMTNKVFTDVFTTFDEEDLKKIARSTSPQQANFKIRLLYLNKTGKNPDDEVQDLLDKFSDKFLEEYEKRKASPSPKEETPPPSNQSTVDPLGPASSGSTPNPESRAPESPFSSPGHSSNLHGTFK